MSGFRKLGHNCQYLFCQNIFFFVLPNNILANVSSYMVPAKDDQSSVLAVHFTVGGIDIRALNLDMPVDVAYM